MGIFLKAGIHTVTKAMSTLYPFSDLVRFKELL